MRLLSIAFIPLIYCLPKEKSVRHGIKNYYTGKVSLGFDEVYNGEEAGSHIDYTGGVDFEDSGTEVVTPTKTPSGPTEHLYGAETGNKPSPVTRIIKPVTLAPHTIQSTTQRNIEDNNNSGKNFGDLGPPPSGFGSAFGLFNGAAPVIVGPIATTPTTSPSTIKTRKMLASSTKPPKEEEHEYKETSSEFGSSFGDVGSLPPGFGSAFGLYNTGSAVVEKKLPTEIEPSQTEVKHERQTKKAEYSDSNTWSEELTPSPSVFGDKTDQFKKEETLEEAKPPTKKHRKHRKTTPAPAEETEQEELATTATVELDRIAAQIEEVSIQEAEKTTKKKNKKKRKSKKKKEKTTTIYPIEEEVTTVVSQVSREESIDELQQRETVIQRRREEESRKEEEELRRKAEEEIAIEQSKKLEEKRQEILKEEELDRLEQKRMRELKEKQDELENLQEQIRQKQQELLENEKRQSEIVSVASTKILGPTPEEDRDADLQMKKTELYEKRRQARLEHTLKFRGQMEEKERLKQEISRANARKKVEEYNQNIDPVEKIETKSEETSPENESKDYIETSPAIDPVLPVNPKIKGFLEKITPTEILVDDSTTLRPLVAKPKSFGIKTNTFVNQEEKPRGFADLKIHKLDPELTLESHAESFLGGYGEEEEDVSTPPSTPIVAETVATSINVQEPAALKTTSSPTPSTFDEKAYAEYARTYYEQYYREWYVNQTQMTTASQVITSTPKTAFIVPVQTVPTVPHQQARQLTFKMTPPFIMDMAPPGTRNMNPFMFVPPPPQTKGNMFGIVDPRLGADQDLTPTQLNRLCIDIYGVSKAFGITDIRGFATSNCSMIKMYYKNATCDQVLHVMEYCEGYFKAKEEAHN